MAKKVHPRNDYVLIKSITLGQTESGIALPDQSIQGKKYVVEALGPKVEGLKVGDSILMVGTAGEDWAFLPGSKDLLIIKEQNCVLIYEEEVA